INFSPLSVIGATKVSHFEIMCRVFGCVPTVGTFRRLYVNSISNRWLSFSKHGGVDDPCCYSKKFDSLKNWNNRFSGLTLRKYPETFLCLAGLSHSFTETNVRPTLLHNNNEEMGLLDFINSVDPFKLKIDELNVNVDKRKKRVAFISGSPPVKKARTEGIVISDSRPRTVGKSPTTLRRLIRQSG
nr:hypothetical protein [Tanacetum cinerariifolium]